MEAVPFIGVSRHRIGIDGVGVTTLAAFHGCPLRCKYCLNPACFGPTGRLYRYTPESLYEKVRIDNLYFLATGGGICFGGGEPLLRTEFISQFRELCGTAWRLTAETSLNVSRAAMEKAAAVIDDYIVDIKDCTPDIYKLYTGRSNRRVVFSLRWLIAAKGAEHIIVRVPLIPNYNCDADRDRSISILKDMGVIRFDRFNYIIKYANSHPTS